jgi:hypothetical protein
MLELIVFGFEGRGFEGFLCGGSVQLILTLRKIWEGFLGHYQNLV